MTSRISSHRVIHYMERKSMRRPQNYFQTKGNDFILHHQDSNRGIYYEFNCVIITRGEELHPFLVDKKNLWEYSTHYKYWWDEVDRGVTPECKTDGNG